MNLPLHKQNVAPGLLSISQRQTCFHDLALFSLSLCVYFNSLYLLLFMMHKFHFYLRALEFGLLASRPDGANGSLTVVVLRNSLSLSW